MVAKLQFSCRNCTVAITPCVSWLDCWSATFLRIIPATTWRLRWHRLQVGVRVCCFLRFCIEPMRYIYHPQLDCYLVVVNSECIRPCELTLSAHPRLSLFVEIKSVRSSGNNATSMLSILQVYSPTVHEYLFFARILKLLWLLRKILVIIYKISNQEQPFC